MFMTLCVNKYKLLENNLTTILVKQQNIPNLIATTHVLTNPKCSPEFFNTDQSHAFRLYKKV